MEHDKFQNSQISGFVPSTSFNSGAQETHESFKMPCFFQSSKHRHETELITVSLLIMLSDLYQFPFSGQSSNFSCSQLLILMILLFIFRFCAEAISLSSTTSTARGCPLAASFNRRTILKVNLRKKRKKKKRWGSHHERLSFHVLFVED